jgi:hypothetical protein
MNSFHDLLSFSTIEIIIWNRIYGITVSTTILGQLMVVQYVQYVTHMTWDTSVFYIHEFVIAWLLWSFMLWEQRGHKF